MALSQVSLAARCAVASIFEQTCETLFGEALGYGRRWKTAAAQALGIGRATLYRYLNGDAVPASVMAKLGRLHGGGRPVHDDRAMITLFARGLLELQKQIDHHGWIKEGYPRVLQRAFDLAAARNVLDAAGGWPTDLGRLTDVAAKPLFEWVNDLSWDPEGQLTAAVLLEDGEITPACIDLALPGRDPEAELVERSGYDLLRSICASRRDGQVFYAAFRRSVVAHPVLSSWTATILTEPVLASAERIDEVVEAFYEPVPEAMTLNGMLPTCVVSGVPLRKHQAGWHTLSRDPDAVRRARAGDCTRLKWRPGTLQLRRAFRLYWCLPGKAELDLAARLTAGGWTCELWPGLDRVDLAAVSPDGSRRIAADVKDHISPENLAARFAGFTEYAADHDCFLVVPDYMPIIAHGYERRFETVRAAHGKPPVAVRTVSGLLQELGVRA